MSRAFRGVTWAGLAGAPSAWALSPLAGYSVAGPACGSFPYAAFWITLAAFGVAVATAALSWPAWRASGPTMEQDDQAGEPYRFIAGLGVLVGALIALVILMQGIAPLILRGCEK